MLGRIFVFLWLYILWENFWLKLTFNSINPTVQSPKSLSRWQNRPFLESSHIIIHTSSFWAWACFTLPRLLGKTAAAVCNTTDEEWCLKISHCKEEFGPIHVPLLESAGWLQLWIREKPSDRLRAGLCLNTAGQAVTFHRPCDSVSTCKTKPHSLILKSYLSFDTCKKKSIILHKYSRSTMSMHEHAWA